MRETSGIPNDTDAESQQILIEGIRRMSVTERLDRALDLSASLRKMVWASILTSNSTRTLKEQRRVLARHLLGQEVVDQLSARYEDF